MIKEVMQKQVLNKIHLIKNSKSPAISDMK